MNREGQSEAPKEENRDDEEREQVSGKGNRRDQALQVMSHFQPIAEFAWRQSPKSCAWIIISWPIITREIRNSANLRLPRHLPMQDQNRLRSRAGHSGIN